jgi:signal transduction histidine kinase
LEFLKNLNYHIRNPLNAIVLLTDLLIQTVRADDKEIHGDLLTIARASSHLERNLRSILDLYRIETTLSSMTPSCR